ncbi:MAG: hypothetical protein AMJ53_14090 [Gammaproteobacteria bacterium SG8_11]|nr:MAG: hypothetical protein AMJ53_14090 [Gammaproteobacteria bacterium SG8_11]
MFLYIDVASFKNNLGDAFTKQEIFYYGKRKNRDCNSFQALNSAIIPTFNSAWVIFLKNFANNS